MTRQKSETIGSLGRSPARTSRIPISPSLPPPVEPPERGAIRRWVHGALFDNVGLNEVRHCNTPQVFRKIGRRGGSRAGETFGS